MNYRSKSVTQILVKRFEKLLFQQQLEHIEEHKIINKNQFGFLKNKSSNDTVISLRESKKTSCWTEWIGYWYFLKLSKRVQLSFSRNLFLKKIARCGFGTGSKTMLNSYLMEKNASKAESFIQTSRHLTKEFLKEQYLAPNLCTVFSRFPAKKWTLKRFYNSQIIPI